MNTETLTNLLCAVIVLLPVRVWGQVDPIVATIGDVPIRQSEVDKRWEQDDPATYVQDHARTYLGEKRALDTIIRDYLLGAEAQRLGISVKELQKLEIQDKLPPVPPDQIQAFLAKAPPPAGSSPEKIKEAAANYLQRDAFAAAQAAYLRQLAAARVKVINLSPFRRHISVTANDRVLGSPAAKVEIVEFADFECPYCKEVDPTLKKILETYGANVSLVWKDFPVHRNAKPAAEAALCAADQGAFWPFHDVLLAIQPKFTPDDLNTYASEVGLDAATFARCLNSGKYFEQGGANAIREGAQYGITATPTIFVNGRPIIGATAATFAVLSDLVSKELASPQEWRVGP